MYIFGFRERARDSERERAQTHAKNKIRLENKMKIQYAKKISNMCCVIIQTAHVSLGPKHSM